MGKRHMYFAESVAEAEAIIDYLENWCDNYSGSYTRHNLLVSWLDEELDAWAWETIWKNNEDILLEAGHEEEEYII